MDFFEWIKNRGIKSRAEPDSRPGDTSADGESVALRTVILDDTMTVEQALNVPVFAGCINRIAETVSTIPVRLYKKVDNKLEEIEDDKRVRLLNDDTGDTLSGVQFKKAIARDYYLGQGGYAYINRKGNKVESLHYVKENELSFMYSTNPVFKDYDVMIQGKKYKPFDFIKLLRNTTNGYSGKSIIAESKDVLNVAYHSLKFEKILVQTGGNKRGFLKSVRPLAQKALDALKQAWRSFYGNNTENVILLNNGLEFQEANNTSVEMQLNENKKVNSAEICKLFNIPAAIISGGATEQDRADFVQFCILPLLKEFECSLNRDLLLESEKGSFYFAFDTSELTKGDIEKRFRAYETASRNGFLQLDEIRLKENMPPLGLDFIRLGLQDVLYTPKTGEFYVPNMNQTGGLNQPKKGDDMDESGNKVG
nr:MAG TPA: portal protein [Caudoviricetes sp.]